MQWTCWLLYVKQTACRGLCVQANSDKKETPAECGHGIIPACARHHFVLLTATVTWNRRPHHWLRCGVLLLWQQDVEGNSHFIDYLVLEPNRYKSAILAFHRYISISYGF